MLAVMCIVALVLLTSNFQVTIVDNLVNSSASSTARLRTLVSPEQAQRLSFSLVDLCDFAG